MSAARSTYRFGPLERRGLFGAVRPGQAGLLVLGAVLAIAALDAAPTAMGALLATLLLVAATVLAVAPVGRRTIGEWAPVISGFAIRSALRATRFRSRAPERGMLARRIPSAPSGLGLWGPAADAPRALRSVRIIEAAYRDRPLGVLSEQSGRRLTAVLACRVASFSLLDSEVQERRLARWGLVLAGNHD